MRRITPALAIFFCGCSSLVDGQQCETSADCDDGWTCVDGTCTKLCNTDGDCPTRAEVCVDGFCERVANAACEADTDCASPGACELSDGAACVAGACIYAFRAPGSSCNDGNPCTRDDNCDAAGACQGTVDPCDSPPAASCSADDQTWVGYNEPGVCRPNEGGCVYEPFEYPCPDCAATCLGRCDTLVCNDFQEGCRTSGACVPEVAPYCHYEYASDGTPCGAGGGRCFGGRCGGCIFDEDCTNPPGPDQCYAATCTDQACDYVVVPAAECTPAHCEAGIEYAAVPCGTDASCSSGSSQICEGRRCNASGSACLQTCASSADCLDGYYCDGAGACQILLTDGSDCTGLGAEACLSGYCDGSFCCAGGDCCAGDGDCPASYASAPVCTNTEGDTDCQGTHGVPRCVGNVCTTGTEPDDSACGTGVLHVCPSHFAPVACTGAADQSAPVCRTDCTTNTHCESGYLCDAPSCVLPQGVGESCTEPGTPGDCQAGLRCENGICCLADGPTCCTLASHCTDNLGCNPTSASCRLDCSDYTTSSCADPDNQYCEDHTCHQRNDDGTPCDAAVECVNGHCVEDVCCDDACDTACVSCLAARSTASSDGTCATMLAGRTDTNPAALCTAGGVGCDANSCTCDDGGACAYAVGQACTVGTDCATGVCECADEQCATHKCAAAGCGACGYTTNGSTCVVDMGSSLPVDDPGRCDGADSCYAGACLADDGESCDDDGDCGSDHCECGDAPCSTGARLCASVSCDACHFTTDGATCTGNRNDGTSCNDNDACTQTDTCASGTCEGSDSIVCDDPPGDCQNPSGACNPGTGACEYSLLGGSVTCRTAADDCDVPEFCDGAQPDCPTDEHATNGADCDDGDSCSTLDTCQDGVCTAGSTNRDGDGDTYFDDACPGGTDCDDTNEDVHPGMTEGPAGDPTCDDTLDNDCNGGTDDGDPNCVTPGCSVDGWCLEHPWPTYRSLYDVWAGPSNTVWAVGAEGTIVHFDGSDWTPVGSPTTQTLRAVFGTASNDIWAVGDEGTILHFNGTGWSVVPSNTSHDFRDVWANLNDAWAVASNNTTLRWSGSEWLDTGQTYNFSSIWGETMGSVWFGSNGMVVEFDGSDWHEHSGSVPAIWGLWSCGPIGTACPLWAATSGGAYRFNGTGWEQALGTGYYLGVSGSGNDDAWLVADTIQHWNLSSGFEVEPFFGTTLNGISAATTRLWAVGENGVIVTRSTAAVGEWETESHVAPPDNLAVAGVGPDDVWAAGPFGLVLRRDTNGWSEMVQQVTDAPMWLDIFPIAANDVWLVGSPPMISGGDARIARWNGSDFDDRTWTGGTLWHGVWASAANDVWVAGDDGQVIQWNGSEWSSHPTPTADDVNDIWGASSDDVWAIQDQRILHWTSSSGWTTESTEYNWLNSIWGTATDDVWVVGDGFAAHRTGGGWNEESLGLTGTEQLNAVWTQASNDVWAVGRAGSNAPQAWHWTGSTWTAHIIPGGIPRDVWGFATDEVVAVGAHIIVYEH